MARIKPRGPTRGIRQTAGDSKVRSAKRAASKAAIARVRGKLGEKYAPHPLVKKMLSDEDVNPQGGG